MIEKIIASALDDIDQVSGSAPQRWDQTAAVLDALDRYGYSITEGSGSIEYPPPKS